MSPVETLTALLSRIDQPGFGPTTPHPSAASLRMPDRASAHEVLRVWAAFDDRYPGPLAAQRGHQPIATPAGVVVAKPMKKLLRYVCYESIADEIEDDDETVAYAKELARDFAEEMPGFGVILEPNEHPDRLLWMPPDAEPVVVWYEDDAFARREPFSAWAASLFG